jgi:type I restriction enzyme, S subunit
MRKLASSPLSDIDAAGLPRDWSLVSLGDLLLGAQYGLDSSTDEAGTVAVVGMKDIQNGKVCINDLPKVNITSTEKTAHLLRKGDILINRTNSRDLVGKTGIVDSDIDAVFASYLVRLRTRPEYVDSSYLTYWLNSPSAQGTIKRIATPAVSQSNVNPTELQRFCIVPLPSLLEQQYITQILRIWDDGIDKITHLIDNKLAVFVKYRETLAWNSDISGDRGWTKGAAETLRVFSITKDGLIPQDEHFKKRIANEDISRHMLVRHNDFVMRGLNFWLGSVDVSLDPKPFCISPDYKVFRLRKAVEPKFFRHLLRAERFRQILRNAAVERASVVRRNLDRETFLESEIPLPPPAYQFQVVAALDASEREISLLREERRLLERQKRGLMQQLFTGQRRVPINDTHPTSVTRQVTHV